MNSYIIDVKGLTKKYGEFTAVNNLDLQIKKGEVFGLLGPNGAGKSTTILMLMGLTEPTSGKVRVCGIDPVFNPIKVKKRVGYLPEDVGFYEDLTGWENLKYTAKLNGIKKDEVNNKTKELIIRVGLKEHMNKKTSKYSRGMRQRLGLADVLIKDPDVIIMDEPTLGIDPSGIKGFLSLIVKLSKDEGITVLFSSHLLHQVQHVCDRVGIFVKGNLLAEGNIKSLAEKLFNKGLYTVQAEISIPKKSSKENLLNSIKFIDGVQNVSFNDDRLLNIDCNRDVSPAVARKIVEAKVDLCALNKKEYGLDDIYYRYFEGGNGHE